MLILRSVGLFILAAFFEIGGAWLVWQGVREHRGWAWIGAGVVALGIYGFVATGQPDSHFGQILAAYGGVFIAGSTHLGHGGRRLPSRSLRHHRRRDLPGRRGRDHVRPAALTVIRLPGRQASGQTPGVPSFDDLVSEGSAVPVAGWDFSWFAGRATEERPPWGYARMLSKRMAALAGVPGAAALDLQTGGGEILATVPAAPPVLVATESWPPNVTVAQRNLAPLGARVVPQANPLDDLPFRDATFDLVTSRHPVGVRWDEVARVLKPDGRYFSQDVGAGGPRADRVHDGPAARAGWPGPRAALVGAGRRSGRPHRRGSARIPRPDGVP